MRSARHDGVGGLGLQVPINPKLSTLNRVQGLRYQIPELPHRVHARTSCQEPSTDLGLGESLIPSHSARFRV